MGKTARRGGINSKGSKSKASGDDCSKQRKNRRGAGREASDGGSLASEIAALGLRVKHVPEDGNCLFHALNDQLQGEGGDHSALRRRVLDYVEAHRDDFEPFVEDDEPFDRYVRRMREGGTWAGHLEVQAAALVLGANVRIYQAGRPGVIIWAVKNFPDAAPLLHLSYHDGIHYNSVRMAGDYGSGPPEPVAVAAQPAAALQSGDGGGGGGWREGAVEEVLAGTGCADRRRAEVALQRCSGDVAAAVEALVEELGAEGEGAPAPAAAEDAAPAGKAAPGDAAAATEQAQRGEEERVRVRLEWASDGIRVAVDLQLQRGGSGGASSGDVAGHRKAVKLRKGKRAAKEPSRNGPCPCGSKRKYKNCCGMAAAARKRLGRDPPAAAAPVPAASAALRELHI